MSAFVEGDVEIAAPSGVRRIRAWRDGAFAVHEKSSGWWITHLPTGFAVAGSFPSRVDAQAAATAIARLRNDWDRITDADLTPRLAASVRTVVESSGGLLAGQTPNNRGSIDTRPRLNGYLVP